MGRKDEARSIEAKVVILGHTGVGKTSMVNRYIRGNFTHTSTTVGAAFAKKDMAVGNSSVSLQIWDTAGQERFRSMAPMYYRGAAAAILVFDATSPPTLEKIDGWVAELQEHASGDMILVIASNKSDLRDTNPDGAVPQKEAQAYANEVGASLFETSAKTGRGIEELFTHVARRLLEADTARVRTAGAAGAGPAGAAGGSRRGVDLTEDDAGADGKKKKKKCC